MWQRNCLLRPESCGIDLTQKFQFVVTRQQISQQVISTRKPVKGQDASVLNLESKELPQKLVEPLSHRTPFLCRFFERHVVHTKGNNSLEPNTQTSHLLHTCDDSIALQKIDAFTRRARPILPKVVSATLRNVATSNVRFGLARV